MRLKERCYVRAREKYAAWTQIFPAIESDGHDDHPQKEQDDQNEDPGLRRTTRLSGFTDCGQQKTVQIHGIFLGMLPLGCHFGYRKQARESIAVAARLLLGTLFDRVQYIPDLSR